MIIRVYFTDTRAYGAIKVENYDVEGEPISLPVSASMIMNVTHPIYLEEPAYDMQNGGAPVRNNVSITGATAHYKVTVGGKTKITLNWGEDYCLYSYKLRYKDGHEEGPFYSGKNMYYELKPTVSDDSEVTVVNYFIKTASINQEAYFSDVDGNLTPKKRFPKSTDKFYSLYFEGALLINGNSLFSKNLSTKSGMDHGFFASGSNSGYSLRITELAGYTLSKLKLSCSGEGSWELTREQLTEDSISDTGNNVIDFNVNAVKQDALSDEEFTKLKNAFGHLKDNGTYTVQAYFTARFIHVTAYEVSQELYEEMREVGIKKYMDEHSLSLFPAENSVKMNVGDTTYSVDGAQTGQYFTQSGKRVTIGVRDKTEPRCVICPVVKITNGSTSTTRDYYRIGAVLYGETESTMVSKHLGSVLPLSMGQTYLLDCNTMNTDQYVSIVYVKYTEKETKPEKPHVLVNDGTVVDQSSLTFYIYEYDETTSEKKLVTDQAELSKYDVRFDVSQHCVGYYTDPHDPTSNQSNATHHANYTSENGEQNVYEHDTRDTVTEFTNGSNATLVGPMAVDINGDYTGAAIDYNTENTDPPGTIHINHHDSFNTPPSDDNVYHSGDDVTVLGTTGVEKTVKGVKYRFDGWDTSDSADTALYIPGDAAKGKFNITGNTDLYAVWTINSPKVTYRLTVPSDVTYTVPSEKNYEYGAPVNVADIPTESDYDPLKYTFHGWNTTSTDLNMNEAGTSFTMPDHNVEFTGYFTENGKVNLSYNANGGTPADKVPDSISRHTKIETTVADMSEECVKKGHSFDHWNTAANGLGDKNYYAGDPITVESSDIVLYAQWKKNNYTVEYYGLKKGETDEKLLKQVNYPYSEATEIGGVTLDYSLRRYTIL